MSLMDLLLGGPTAAQRFQEIMPMLSGHQISGAVAGPATVSPPSSHDGGGMSSNWQDVAAHMAERRYGYSPQQVNEMNYIIGHESSWDPTAVNPNVINGKQAVGIPQHMVPVSDVSQWQNMDPRKQISWFLNYVQDRYGGIDQAYDFKRQNGWY